MIAQIFFKLFTVDIYTVLIKDPNDVYEVMNDPRNKAKLSRFFTWNSECIKNIKTGSEYRYMANNAKTGDSYRPGKVNHDEVHEFEDTSALTTSITGLGKVDQPRRFSR